MISAIVAVDDNFGIGRKDNLLAHIPEDMKMFKKITTNNIVVMGRKTYDSLPNKPLPNRINFVITTNPNKFTNQYNLLYSNMESIKDWLSKDEVRENSNIYIIGGGQIYKELLPFCERVYITKIFHAYDNVDTYFPNIDNMLEWEITSVSEINEHNGIKYQFCIYNRTILKK
jgi:dihydrofolate reductase